MIKKLVAFSMFSLSNLMIIAQCAMCKAGAEQSLERGSSAVNWINYAIVFLMSMPLLLIFSLYLLYRRNQRKEISEA